LSVIAITHNITILIISLFIVVATYFGRS